MKPRLFLPLLALSFLVSFCKKENDDGCAGSILYQKIDHTLVLSGKYELDIDQDLTNDYELELFHRNINHTIFTTNDTFFIKLRAINEGYLYFERLPDCIPCYEYGDHFNGRYSPEDTAQVISSYFYETGIEGAGDRYICLLKGEYRGWLSISASPKRDTLHIKDCAFNRNLECSFFVGQKNETQH